VRFGVVVFPGSNCDYDACHVLSTFPEAEPYYLWHKDHDLRAADCIILPGGFSYGDYLRTGAIARFSPIMQEVAAFAESGGLVLGICNGFQILAEAHLLHGALRRNRGLRFLCLPVHLRVERTDTPFTRCLEAGQVLQVPINHFEGNWTAGADSLQEIERQDLVAFRYCDGDGQVVEAANPNGATDNVAGILSERGNVLGMMPHPERVCEGIVGGVDGRGIFQSMIETVLERRGA
jgi:phosphoribosylformylglycinamidine synthase